MNAVPAPAALLGAAGFAGFSQALLGAAGFAGFTLGAWLGAWSLWAAPDRAARLERAALQAIRAGFLLLGLALAAGAAASWRAAGRLWPGDPRSAWMLVVWLVWFTVLHVHRVKAFKGRTAALAGLAGWVFSLLAFLALGRLG